MSRRIVIDADQPLGILQDRIFLLHAAIRRQAALAFAARHGSARRVEAQADIAGRVDRGVERAIIGEDIEMVGAGRTARMDEFGHRNARRNADRIVIELGPDRIERLQPDKQLVVLNHYPGEVLVHVVVRVHHARHDHMARQVAHLVGAGSIEFRGRTDRLDDIAVDQERAV
jgi:hypothetical protein